MAKIAASEQDARETVEKARADAQKHLQEQESALTQEVAAIRRERQQKRQAEFEAALQQAETKLEGVRTQAVQRVPELAKEVLAIFIPDVKKG